MTVSLKPSGTSRAVIPLKPKDGLNGAPNIFCRCGKNYASVVGLNSEAAVLTLPVEPVHRCLRGLNDDEGKTPEGLASSIRCEKATDAERQLPSGSQELFFGLPELPFDWRESHPTRFGSSGSRPDSGEEFSDFPEWMPDGRGLFSDSLRLRGLTYSLILFRKFAVYGG